MTFTHTQSLFLSCLAAQYAALAMLGNCLLVFYVHVTVHRNKFLFHKTNRPTNFPNLFCQENLHVSGSSSAHHQEFSTVHSALVYAMQL